MPTHCSLRQLTLLTAAAILISLFQIYFGKQPTFTAETRNKMLTTVSEHQMNAICNETSGIVRQVYSQAIQNKSEHHLWDQTIPAIFLSCEQFVRSVQIKYENYDMSPTLSLLRLAKKLQRFEKDRTSMTGGGVPLKIVAIGGSMSTGFVDVGSFHFWDLAWPRKLENFLHEKWPDRSMEVLNLAIGGANEETWLGNLDRILQEAPDVILVESAVNDQSDYKDQAHAAEVVHRTSKLLLNTLLNFPSEPAVFSLELFRVAWTNSRDANMHCNGHVKAVFDRSLDQTCLYCEQWWMPQSWRRDARDFNSISYISYRDAVWPEQDHPPEELCQYWSGLSHPQAGVHAMVASVILFQFILADYKKDALLKRFRGFEENMKINTLSADQGICLNPVSSFRAVQGDPTDPMNLVATNNHSSCWGFRADSKEKYGWICEVDGNSNLLKQIEFYRLHESIYLGQLKLVIISRLVSYDDRMATAQVWFSAPNSNNSANVFVGDPVWNVTSSHAEKTSIPQPYSIRLDNLELKNSSGMQWSQGKTLEVTFNIKLLVGSSESRMQRKNDHLGIDKFKLLGIVSC